MNSGKSVNSQRQITGVEFYWEKYVLEMSSFYFNVFSEYVDAVAASQVEFEPEDVLILKELGSLYAITEQKV